MEYKGPIFKLNDKPFIINKKYAGGGFKEVELVKVIDGDTAHFKIDGKKRKVRFLVIDTPELSPYQMPYSLSAKQYTEHVLTHCKKIYLQTDIESGLYDETPSKRLLAWVWADDELLNYNLVEMGYAYVKYVTSEKQLYINDLRNALKIADERNIRIHEEEVS